ncbi:hypothetical protein B0H11DRAFT_23910 [Mycena galericulata]|nr:hypothetical protein B0H11DRAFT_23910 [Mycena galericulata]
MASGLTMSVLLPAIMAAVRESDVPSRPPRTTSSAPSGVTIWSIVFEPAFKRNLHLNDDAPLPAEVRVGLGRQRRARWRARRGAMTPSPWFSGVFEVIWSF